MRKTLSFVAVTFLAGCGAPYKWIAHAEPNPFVRPGCRAVVEPIHSDRLLVGSLPEPAYLQQKKAESADSYENDKRISDAEFHQKIFDDHGSLFMPGTPDNTFVIRPIWTHWEPGFYAFVAAQPAVADLIVEIHSPSGQLLDSIAVETKASDYSSGGRMKLALRQAGRAVSRYISDNWMCAAH